MTINNIRQLQQANQDLETTITGLCENFINGANNIEQLIELQCKQIDLEQQLINAIEQFNCLTYQPRYDFSKVV